MSGKLVTYTCSQCGQEATRARVPPSRLCYECAVRKSDDVAHQLHNHAGPAYEKWQRAIRNNLGRIADGIGRAK